MSRAAVEGDVEGLPPLGPCNPAFEDSLSRDHVRPADNLHGLIRDICLIWEEDRPLFRKVMASGEVDPEVRDVIQSHEMDRSHAIDAISQRLIARYSRRATVEALWALTGFSVFASIRRHALLDDVVEMLTGMAITIVDPDELWQLPRDESQED